MEFNSNGWNWILKHAICSYSNYWVVPRSKKKKNVLTWFAQWLLDIWRQGHRHQILDLQLLANKETKRTYELKGNNCIEKQKSHLTYYVTSALCY